jgi:hypothetical protein
MNGSERVTCAFYADNDINFLVGTDQGTMFILSMKAKNKKKVELRGCHMRNLGKINKIEPEQIKREEM